MADMDTDFAAAADIVLHNTAADRILIVPEKAVDNTAAVRNTAVHLRNNIAADYNFAVGTEIVRHSDVRNSVCCMLVHFFCILLNRPE